MTEINLKRIQSYKEWEKRKLLVIHMETRNLDVESCLRLEEIPFYAITCRDAKLEDKINNLINSIAGIIITGSRTTKEDLPGVPEFIINLGLPILGICYGNEWLGQMLGAKIIECSPPMGEFSEVEGVLDDSLLFKGIENMGATMMTMAHFYMLEEVPPDCKKIASTQLTPIAGFENLEKKIFGLQFHPEKGLFGDVIFTNFLDYCREKKYL